MAAGELSLAENTQVKKKTRQGGRVPSSLVVCGIDFFFGTHFDYALYWSVTNKIIIAVCYVLVHFCIPAQICLFAAA